jgi:hypothetical protein
MLSFRVRPHSLFPRTKYLYISGPRLSRYSLRQPQSKPKELYLRFHLLEHCNVFHQMSTSTHISFKPADDVPVRNILRWVRCRSKWRVSLANCICRISESLLTDATSKAPRGLRGALRLTWKLMRKGVSDDHRATMRRIAVLTYAHSVVMTGQVSQAQEQADFLKDLRSYVEKTGPDLGY